MTVDTATGEITDDRNIHQRIVAVLGELPAIGKTQQNKQQGYMFRGIDDVLDALNPLLAKHGVYYAPHVLERIPERRDTKGGGTSNVVHLHVRYTFRDIHGMEMACSCWGEGSDSGDKATNKAMTAAQKYMLFQVFAISTSEAQDGDAVTPEATARSAVQERKAEWGDAPLPDGWKTFEEFDEAHQTLAAGIQTLPTVQKDAVKQYKVANEIGWPVTKAQYDQLLDEVERIGLEAMAQQPTSEASTDKTEEFAAAGEAAT